MKILLFSFLVALNTSKLLAQCPEVAILSAPGKCLKLEWQTPPVPLPLFVIQGGFVFWYESGTGSSSNSAIYRKFGTTGSCGNFNSPLNSNILLPSGFFCDYVAGILPNSFQLFSVSKLSNNKANVEWTIYENGIDSFSIERSIDGSSFTEIKKIKSKGNGQNSYSVLDDYSILLSKRYYRVTYKLPNNTLAYSKIQTVEFETSTVPKIFPNPTKSNLSITHNNKNLINSTVQIANLQGVSVHHFVLKSYLQEIVLSLKAGMYFIIFKDGSTQKLVVL